MVKITIEKGVPSQEPTLVNAGKVTIETKVPVKKSLLQRKQTASKYKFHELNKKGKSILIEGVSDADVIRIRAAAADYGLHNGFKTKTAMIREGEKVSCRVWRI